MAALAPGEGEPPDTTPPPPGSDDVFSGIDVQAFQSKLADLITKQISTNKELENAVAQPLKPVVESFAVLIALIASALAKGQSIAVAALEPFLEELVKAVNTLLEPVFKLGGDLSGVYVKALVDGLDLGPGGSGINRGAGAGSQAGSIYDKIVAPLAQISFAVPPTRDGSGQANIQRSLAGITQIHLATWLVNVISNLTGVGALHFINSFDEVATASLNARGLSRVAMKPYLNTFMTEPATAELNVSYPLKHTGPDGIVRNFLRGGISADKMRLELRKAGYDDAVMAQILTTIAKELTVDNVAYLVKTKHWTDDQALTYLTGIGYPKEIANIPLSLAKNKLVFELRRLLADELVTQVVDRVLSPEKLQSILRLYEFSEDEIHAFAALAATKLERSKRLTLEQVRSLFNAKLVDLDFVLTRLLDEGYSMDDAHLLILLDFTELAERQTRRNVLAAQARLASQSEGARAKAKRDAGQADLAAALQRVADAKAKLAQSLG